MTKRTKFLALLTSVAVNAAALAAAHDAMTQFTKREQLALIHAGKASAPDQRTGSTVLATRGCLQSGVL
jgi:hypothetical protein